jgi:8-oxo-dGTP pyrophosphatase MutT (NUDIX family)
MNSTSPAVPVVPAAPARPIRHAATLILLRDGPAGMEVLLLRRAEKADDQNSGASVFPGGVLDAHDRGLHLHCQGLDDRAASERLGVAEGGLDYYAAAVRECFEEAGVLFACDADDRLVELDGFAPGRLEAMRDAAEQGTDALLAMCDAHGWRLAVDRLAYFSHWLTPPSMPRRFDTRFFIAQMPAAQRVIPDGRETVAHMWLQPSEAVDPRRGLKLMNVTRRTLESLAGFATAAECMAHARGLARLPLNMPRLADGPDGRRAVNIDEAAYAEIGLVDPDGTGRGGPGRYALLPGDMTQLTPRIRRVAGAGGDAGPHSFFAGAADGPFALIDPMPGAGAAAAPGPVRWLLSTAPRTPASEAALAQLAASWPGASVHWPAPGERLALGGDTTLQAIPAARDGNSTAQQFLLIEERVLFTGAAAAPSASAAAEAEWIAPASGFLVRASRSQP